VNGGRDRFSLGSEVGKYQTDRGRNASWVIEVKGPKKRPQNVLEGPGQKGGRKRHFSSGRGNGITQGEK